MINKSDLIIILILIFFLTFNILNLTFVFSDETIYINMAKALANGLIPYKDFFYAHPPIQLFLLMPIASYNNFSIIKVFISLIGILSVFFTYLIAKKLFNEKVAFFSFIFLLLFPGFLIFGIQAMGMFEALLFFLIGFYFLINKRFTFSIIFFIISIFTRYLALLLFPLMIFYFYKKFSRENLFRYLLKFFAFSTISFLILFLIFGENFVNYTFLYHLHSNIKSGIGIANWFDQYLALGYFTIFLSIFTLFYGYLKRNFLIILFSFYPLIYDLLILLLLRQVIYHYFVIPLPFLFIAAGATFWNSKSYSLRFFMLFVIFLSIYSNWNSFGFYYDKNKNKVFYELINYTFENTNETDLIFGEPRSLNYVSFVTNRKIVNNYFDSDLKFINFAGREKILNEVKKAKPKLIFANQFYADFFKENYQIVKEWKSPGYYHLILMKLKD